MSRRQSYARESYLPAAQYPPRSNRCSRADRTETGRRLQNALRRPMQPPSVRAWYRDRSAARHPRLSRPVRATLHCEFSDTCVSSPRLVFKPEQSAFARHHEIEIAVTIEVGNRDLDSTAGAVTIRDHVLGPLDVVRFGIGQPLIPIHAQRFA